MDRTEALQINDWEILLKQKHEPFPQLFYASNCTENQAFTQLDKEFSPSNRYVLHIRQHEAIHLRPTTIRRRSSMPDTFTMTITITSNTKQRGNLQGSQNLSPMGFFFKEIKSAESKMNRCGAFYICCAACIQPNINIKDINPVIDKYFHFLFTD